MLVMRTVLDGITVEVSISPRLTPRGEQPDTERRTVASEQTPPPFTTLEAERQLMARKIDAQRAADGIPNLVRRF